MEVECGVYCVNICMNDGALRAVKKLYIRLCAARDIRTIKAQIMICDLIICTCFMDQTI